MRFVLIDRILELVPGQRIVAEKHVSADEEFFQDHFPGFPVVPGVLLTEMMAQAAGKCLEAESFERGRPMLAKIVEAGFRDWMRPDETARISAEVRKSRPTFATVATQLEVGDRKLCTAELFFTFVPHDRFAPGYRDQVLQEFLQRPKAEG